MPAGAALPGDAARPRSGSERLPLMAQEQQVFRGLLKSYSPKDGYGFIACPLLYDAFGRDVYINHSRLPPGATSGCHVEFTITISSKGQPQADRVVLVEENLGDLADAAKGVDVRFLELGRDLSEYTIVLDKRRRDQYRLGIDVDTSHDAALLVDAVTGGLVDEWNRQHPALQVKVGDHIVEVNGVSGDAQAVFKECKMANHLRMRIRRAPTEDGAQENAEGITSNVYVVTWNILAGAYASLKMYPDVEPPILRAPRRRAQAAAALAHLDADVICLQEVDCPLEELGFGPEFDSVVAQRPEGRSDCCAIAWRKERLELGPAGHRTIMFDDHPPPAAFECDRAHYDTGNVGLAVELRVRSDPGKRCITVATTHLCWEPHKMDVRAWQLHNFTTMAKELAGPRILLCGDFNSAPGTRPHQLLAQGLGLESAYGDVESVAVTNSNAHACDGGFAAMIDYIWYPPKWFALKRRLHLPTGADLRASAEPPLPDSAPVPTLLSACWPSDHLALGAVFELTNPVVDDWDD